MKTVILPPDPYYMALRDRMLTLADEWWEEEDGIEHVAACQDFGCKDCVVIACATDLRARIPDPGFRPERFAQPDSDERGEL